MTMALHHIKLKRIIFVVVMDGRYESDTCPGNLIPTCDSDIWIRSRQCKVANTY